MKKSASLVMLGLLLGGCGGKAEQLDNDPSSTTSSSPSSSNSSSSSSSSFSSGSSLATDASGLLQVPRSLPLLSAAEYRNTLTSLFGPGLPANVDELLINLAEQEQVENTDYSTEAVDSARLQQYFEIARLVSISHWAKSRFLTENIKSRHALSDHFIDEFALQAYRRLLQKNEREYFEDLLIHVQDPLEALEIALQTVLTSPTFLYHSRLGLSKFDVARHGWRFDVDHTMGFIDGFGSVTAAGINFQDPNDQFYESLPDIRYNYQRNPLTEGIEIRAPNPAAQHFPMYPLSRITLTARAFTEGTTPELAIRIGDGEVYSVRLSETEPRKFSFLVEGFEGSQQIFLISHSDGYELPVVESVSVAPALHVGAPPELNLETENDNDFLLSPFETAAFIAYERSGRAPDIPLLTKAITGELNDPKVVEAEIERLQYDHEQLSAQGM